MAPTWSYRDQSESRSPSSADLWFLPPLIQVCWGEGDESRGGMRAGVGEMTASAGEWRPSKAG